ncbi:sugar transferase [Zhongshania sp.]|uniref:sugar transferase n=1 Tax=Zhongshania sp. TaxID=1971902 RepID=UPI0035650314
MIKRIFDFLLAAALLVSLSPVFLLLFISIRIFLGGNVFFIQPRPGRHGKPFRMVKFRTMNNLRDSEGVLLADEYRLTRFGRMLRASSMDELPELLNVLAGDMSLVGPRPLLMEYLPLYSQYHARRHEVRPGITGWAQVNGRNALSWNEKLDLDVFYVDHKSFLLDVKILFLTIVKVVRREGVSHEGEATMSKFTGSL